MEFTYWAYVRYGWETFKKRPWFFIGTFFFINTIADFSIQSQNSSSSAPPVNTAIVISIVVLAIVLAVVQTFAKMGRIRFLLKAHDTPEEVRFKDLWAPRPFWKFLITNIVYGLIMFGGFILLIVPGIIWAIKYQYAPYLVMERDIEISEALRESGRMTKGYKWQLFLFGLVLALVNVAGALCLLVGLLVSVPVTMLAYAHVYRLLESRVSAPAVPAEV